jgi:hypothetical protein
MASRDTCRCGVCADCFSFKANLCRKRIEAKP